jgi:acyl-coenzyme A thioesterase PaaI-like protein
MAASRNEQPRVIEDEGAMRQCREAVKSGRRQSVKIEMTAKFIIPGMGDRLTTEGKVIGGGRSTLFCEAEVHDEAGNLVAKGMGTLKPVKNKDA